MAEPDQGTSSKRTAPVAVDAALGAAALATKATLSVTRQFARVAAPIGKLVMHPPVLNERLHPARVVDALVDRGHEARTAADDDLSRIVAAVVPPVVNEVLDNLDLTELVRQRVNIDELVSTVDIEAVIDRVDIAAIVDRIDIDAIAKRIDLDAIVDRIDIDAIVERIDVDTIVRRVDIGAVVSQVDVDAIARRIELDAIVKRIDIDAIVDRIDVDAIVRRLDLVSLAEEVVNGIDLPEIIRESTGSMASEVVRDARMQSIDADVAIARIVDRLIRRRRARRTEILGRPDSRGRADLPEPPDVTQMQPLSPEPERPKEEELRP